MLQQFVVDGRVNYQGIKEQPAELNQYLLLSGNITHSEFNQWNKNQQLAFTINLYNASTIKLIVDHYPIKSIKNIRKGLKGPWDQSVVTLYGKQITLNYLEHKIIRKKYKEPRVHMALVCAAIGCPPLRNEAYTAKHWTSNLMHSLNATSHPAAGMIIDNTTKIAKISSIFKWYGGDFTSVTNFIEKQSGKSLNLDSAVDINTKVQGFCSRVLRPG